MVGFSLPLTFPLLTTIILYHRVGQKSIRNVAQSLREFFVQFDGRQALGKNYQKWKIVEKRQGDERRRAER